MKMIVDIIKKTKKCYKKGSVKGNKIFLKKKKNSNSMVANYIKIFLKVKSKNWLSIKKYYKMWKNKNALQ